MRNSRFALAVAFIVVSIGASVRDAAACSCDVLAKTSNMTEEQLSAWRFDRAKIIVTGRVTDVHASIETKRGDWRVVIGRLKVNSVQKGDVPLSDVTLLTGFGVGDCGMAGGLLVALAQNRDLTVELRTVPEYQGEYAVDICGFAKLSAGHKD